MVGTYRFQFMNLPSLSSAKFYVKGYFLGIICLVLISCSTGKPSYETDLSLSEKPQSVWSRVKFRLTWPEGEELDFSYDLLIADQILRPINETFGEQIELWRFHRRAARDGAGHQFSFIYYSPLAVSNQIETAVQNSYIVEQLQSKGVLESLIFVSGSKPTSEKIEATSDSQWPIEIQKSWPSFIQGVSQSWLDLIAQEKNKKPGFEMTDIHVMVEYYQDINKSIVDKWGKYGRHAYFHHLNAVFGYSPVYLYESDEWSKF
jgi:hypothetical protein